MRNLTPTVCTAMAPDPALAGAECSCVDSDLGNMWVAVRGSIYTVGHNKQAERVFDLIAESHVTPGDQLVGIEHVTELDSVCVASRGGEVLTCNFLSHEVEGQGSFKDGILCMAWSPDHELVLFVSTIGNLVLMTSEFDTINETPILSQEFGEATPVSVGWGKKETQFRGSLGKTTSEMLKQKPVQPALSWDDKQVRISWRGDGKFFVCSSVDPFSGARQMRVWSRECVLHSTCEPMDQLGQALHWRPNGSLFASSQLKPHRHDIVFFECNGLHHGHFSLRNEAASIQVREVQWSNDSSVLALWLEREVCRGAEEDCTRHIQACVQLWTTGNYHWYLKQELRLPDYTTQEDPVNLTLTAMLWDPILPLRIHLLTGGGQYLCYNWRWSVAVSLTLTLENAAGVVVIDGEKLLYTPFRWLSVPPPMAAHELQLPSPALIIATSPPPYCNHFIVLMADGMAALFEDSLEQKRCTDKFMPVACSPRLRGIFSVPCESGSSGLHGLHQLVWWETSTLLGISCQSHDQLHDMLVEMELVMKPVDKEMSHDGIVIKRRCHMTCPGRVLCLHGNPNTSTVAVELTDGTVWCYTSGGNLAPWQLPEGGVVKFSTPCEELRLACFQGLEVVIGLNSRKRHLYVNNTLICSNCTSLGLHDRFLLMTTDTHSCHCISFHDNPSVIPGILVRGEESVGVAEGTRHVERGSRIVTAIPHDVRLVLQMPRGNLETICPRALVLTVVRKKLDKLEFREAFLLMRRHRINLNLLCDHNLTAFLSQTQHFVQQLSDVQFINLFLTELREENVCMSMYPVPGQEPSPGQSRSQSEKVSKVNQVCDAVREALSLLGEGKFLLSVITSLVKKNPPELESVLSKIKQMKAQQPVAEGVTVQAALDHTLFLVDVNKLYDVALGMYDFDLVVMVAEKSQKDPKEYLPLLNELKKLPIHYQQYRIDCSLKRYSRALDNISQCSDRFDECLALVQEHGLYKQALTKFTDPLSHENRVISDLYGSHLMELGKPKEAGIVFHRSGQLRSALSAFERACCWEYMFVVASQLGLAAEELARKVAVRLKLEHKYMAASRVLLDYGKAPQEAITVLLEGGVWEEAFRLMHYCECLEMVETQFKPALLEAVANQSAFIDKLLELFLHHSSRLLVVREEKMKRMQEQMDRGTVGDEKDIDLFSDTNTMATHSLISSWSNRSRTSAKSAKSQRKTENKKWSLREGSKFEDLALIDALRESTATVDRMQEEIGSLLTALSLLGFLAEAGKLQEQFSCLLDQVLSLLPSIWPDTPIPPSRGSIMGPHTTANSLVAAVQQTYPIHSLRTQATPSIPPPIVRKNVQWRLDNIY